MRRESFKTVSALVSVGGIILLAIAADTPSPSLATVAISAAAVAIFAGTWYVFREYSLGLILPIAISILSYNLWQVVG